MMKNQTWWTGLLVFACAGAMVAACGGGTPSPATPDPAVGAPVSDTPAAVGDEGGKEAEGPTTIPHAIEGRENCTSCHALAGDTPSEGAMPADHAGRDNSACQGCHKSAM